MAEGLIHVYTGNGKGKTTAAIGVSLRAHFYGRRVYIVQFMKTSKSGEVEFINSLADDNYRVFRFEERHGFLTDADDTDTESLTCGVKRALDFVRDTLDNNRCDMLVLDEIICAHCFGFVTKDEILDIIALKPRECELIMTGRGAPQWLMDASDYVTEMKLIKHPYESGTNAREGIEF